MARDSFNEQKNKNVYSKKKKKKDEKKTVAKKPQSSSSSKAKSTSQTASKSTFMGGTQTAPKKQQASQQKQNAPSNTTSAQRQKMGMQTTADLQAAKQHRERLATTVKNNAREASSEENKSFMQRQKSGTLTNADRQKVEDRQQRRAEIARNTGRAAKKGAQDSITGYRKTLADISEMTQSTDRASYGQAAKLGIDKDRDKDEWAKLERNREKGYTQAREKRLELQKEQDERQAEWDERTKNAKGFEKALYGAAESGTGMLVDMGVGAVTGTGQFGALASMGLRTYGTTRGSAEKEGATEKEDRLYSLAQAGKEMGTELMFQGAGLAKNVYTKGKVGLSLADRAANTLTKGLTGKAADVVGAGTRLLGGTAEENAEEAAGWIVDPLIKELTYGKNVRERFAQSMRANIPQIANQADADRVASYFNTSEFTDDLTEEYKKSGMSDEEATALADEMRDYYVAYYSGDQQRLEELEDDLARKLSGQPGLSKEAWSKDELLDTFAATTLLTMSTGLPGAVNTSVKGNQAFDDPNSFLRQKFGDNAVKIVADEVKNSSDPQMSLKAETMKKRLDEGKDLTGTQKWDLMQGYQQKQNDTAKKAQASYGTVNKAMQEQNLVSTMGVDEQGNTVYAKETQREYNKTYAENELTVEAVKNYLESDNSISDDEARRSEAVNRAMTDLHVGSLTVGDAHEFGYGNTLAREALKISEGIDLDQYIVRDNNGNVDYAATNEATENALYAINAENAIKAAQKETAVYIDDTRGRIDSDIMGRMGVNGQATWKNINKSVDPRNINEYLTTARAASYFYSAGRNTDMDMEDAIKQYSGGAFRNVDKTALRRAFAAGSRDRIIANTPGYGQTVSSGSNIAMKKTEPIITGQFVMDENIKDIVPDTVQQAYIALAMSTNTNIYLKGDLSPLDKDGKPILDRNGNPVQLNGMSKGNDIYINVNASAEQNLGYVFMHEMTHQIKQYAPNEYMALENLVRERWFNKNNAQMQQAIQSRIDLYKTKGGQSLTEEEAIEEIIADAMAEAMDDPNFAAQVCEEDIDLGQAILNSIKAALRSIRQIFANNEFQNESFHNGLLSYLDILDEAEKMWLNALHTARINKANGLIADWQDRANRASRYSATSDGGYIGKSMSRRASKAYANGEMPISKWSKSAIADAVYDINDSIDVSGLTLEELQNNFLTRTSWHHTGAFYNATDFYSPDEKAIADITQNDITDIINNRTQKTKTQEERESEKRNREIVNESRDVLRKLNIIYNSGVTGLKSLGGVISRWEKGSLDLADEYQKSLDAIRSSESSRVNQWRNLPEDNRRMADVDLYDNDIEAYASNLYKSPSAKTKEFKKIKSTLERTANVADTRFSLSAPVERVKDLIAVHNLNEEDLVGNLGLGGFPMPSIAITKDSMGHEKYGDISLLFHSDTIDPTVTSANQVFGGDAYTPTFPTVHYKANSKVSKKLVDMYYGNSNTLGYDAMRPMYEYAVTIDDTLDRAGGEAKLIERAKNDTSLMRLYLRMNGKDIEDIIKTTTTSLSDAEVARNDFWINELGKEAIQEARPSDLRGREAMQHFANWRDDRLDNLKKSYEKLCREVYGFDDAEIQEIMADEKTVKKEISSNIVAASNYLKNGRDTVKTEIDYDATWKLVEDATKANGYDAWVEDLFKGIEEKSGIRNDKDFYTPAGNRRSWESLHEPVTLDNVVRQMKKELDSGGGTFLGNNPVGAAQKKYKNLDELRADEDRLQQLDDENYGKLREQATAKLSKVAHEIYDNSPKRQNSYAMFGAIDVGSDVAEALNKTRNKDKLKAILEKDYAYNVSDENMNDLMDALQDLANLPTGYFEAKPKRAVRFDEVKAAIVPEGFADHLKAQLSTYGTSIYEYNPDIEGDRTEKVNQAASENDLRFSISAKYDEPYMNAVNSGNMDEAQRLVDEAAKDAGFGLKVYHGTTSEPFTRFLKPSENLSRQGFAPGFIYASSSEDYATFYSVRGEPFSEDYDEGYVLEGYLNIENMLDIGEVDDYAFRPKDGSSDLLMDIDFNDEQRINDWATDDFYTVAKTVGMTPFELVQHLGETVFNTSEATWEFVNRQEFARLISNLGHDGIKVIEDGSDAYGVLEPNQFKSADTVTYAEDGSVIPLSERFDPNNDDIRYSLPTQDSDGKILTDAQMEYFKNSQARDSQGRLVPVYHTTNSGGFTVFDPEYSQDHRSLFFASNWSVSQTYGSRASDPINLNNEPFTQWDDFVNAANKAFRDYPGWDPDKSFYENAEFSFMDGLRKAKISFEDWMKMSHREQWEADYSVEMALPTLGNPDFDWQGFEFFDSDTMMKEINWHMGRGRSQRGYYACYLNMENPFIIDAKGANWNDLPVFSQEEWDKAMEDLKEKSTFIIESMSTVNATDEGRLRVHGRKKNNDGSWEDFVIFKPYSLPINKDSVYKLIAEDLGDGGALKRFFNRNWNKDHLYYNYFESSNYNIGGDWFTDNGESQRYPASNLIGAAYERVNTRELAKRAKANDYDGVIIRNCKDLGGMIKRGADPLSDIFIAFSSNQVKDINNENPTENPDIRYSIADEESTMNYAQTNAKSTDDLWATDPVIAEGRLRYSMSKRDFINGVTNKWNPAWKTNGEILHEPSVKNDIRDVIMGAMRGSDTDAKYRQEMVNETMLVARKAYNLMKKDKPSQAANLLYDHAHTIIDNLEFFGTDDQTEFERYKELRDYLKHTKITVPYDRRRDIDYSAYRKRNFGKILLGNDGIAPDVAWGELNEMWPEVFTEDIKGDIPGIMLQIENALDICQPMAQAYTSEQCEEFAGDIADALYDILYEGKEYKSLADRFDDKAKAMKARHAEAMSKMQDKLSKKDAKYEELKQRYQYDTAYLRAEKQRAVREVKEQNKQKEAETRYNRVHRDLYNSVLKEYKDLSHKLLNPSKDRLKNIPEQLRQPLAEMLVCFDLEKERSKELEAQYMIPTKSQLKFRQLKDAMEKVASENRETEFDQYFNYIKDKMTDIADRVDGKTIDYLDNADIQVIKEMMKGLNAAIKNWQQLEIDGQNYQAQQVCDKVGEGATEHQKLYGKAHTYSGPREIIDNIVNMGELTPIYFFRQLKGMYDMYRQLRKGFNDYVVNERQIINKISDILSPYYKKNKKGQLVKGSEVEEWRHSESAETFTLISGEPITLTIAQRMSLYCLAKRDHAKAHMLSDNGGIVASEITAGSKIHKAQEMIKGKDVEYKEAHLTQADIDNICATLTPEQIHIADQLQELMSKDMSELGNKTSMRLIGIEMYKETDYFPIKVQGESLPKSLDNIGMREKVRNPGFSNPLKENASNPIIIDDIFAVTAKHCNEMNMYSSYAVPLTNFMKVYNGSVLDENGKSTKIQTVIKETYGEKAIQYIDNFLDDINGNSFKRHGGLDDVLDKALGRAKRAAVFANLRVLLQQPTAIVRACAVMSPKNFWGVRPSAKAAQEMFEHCPIAQWKGWGYFDTHFGRDIEDVMMGANTPSKADYIMSELYGQADIMTWSMIWQAVKKEVKAQNKGIDETSQEFWDLCNERASFVFDSTQVVDSPFHRSNDMRSKNGLVKQLTSFQSEPTLSFNVLRQGFVDAYEAAKKGNTKKARKLLERVLAVWVTQAVTVALAQSFVDALRRKGADDDEDPKFLELWWTNFIADFVDDLNPINNVYYFKEIVPPILNALTGQYVFGQQNLTFQWVTTLTNGIQQVRKKWEKGEGYSKSWYDCLTELFGGVGYLAGLPMKTMMRGAKNAAYWFNRITGIEVFAADGSVDEAVDSFVDRFRNEKDTTSGKTSDKKSKKETDTDTKNIETKVEEYRESLSDNYTDEQKDELVKQYEKRVKKGVKSEEVADRDKDTMLFEAEKAAAGYEGAERDKRIWQSVSQGYKSHIDSGDYAYIARMRSVVEQAGGNLDYFDEQIVKATKTALKKTIEPGGADTESEMVAQQNMRYYLQGHGVTQEEISSEIIYKSASAKDLKVAFRLGDEEAIIESSYPLMYAGLTTEDYEKLYTNRNRMDLSKYDGKYKDRLKSTGKFIWPTTGTITSHFGYRNSPTAGASSNHPAIDIGAPQGTAVVAADGGVVIYAGRNSGYGNSVGIRHDNGMVTYYNHLYSWNVNVGDTVGQGQQIAQVGSTGISTGPHLDFKILDQNGKPVDPEKFLNKTS